MILADSMVWMHPQVVEFGEYAGTDQKDCSASTREHKNEKHRCHLKLSMKAGDCRGHVIRDI
jgi:hypothetical protein